MYWYGCWLGSVITLGVTFICAIALLFFRYTIKGFLTPNRILILGTWTASSVFFYPLYLKEFGGTVSFAECSKAVLASAHHAIRIFGFDGGYMGVVDMVDGLSLEIQTLYTVLGAVLYLCAPILTIGLILSFFKNLMSRVRYTLSFLMKAHVFSDLNEKTVALAKSIDEKYNKVGEGKKRRYRVFRRALIVFTDVRDKADEKSLMLVEDAKEIDAILFGKDLKSIKYRNRRFSIRKVNFYLISDNETEKIHHAERIMKEYDIDGVELRIFSSDIRSELLLASQNVEHMKAIRVNDVQSLVYHNLDSHGLRLFENARCVGNSDKVISAVIVGLGSYGLEMMKALTWFCQMDGYRIKINAFDIDKNAREHFTFMCPELMSGELNGQDIPGEARYEINIHGGIDINTPAFADELSKIKDATYIFVCLGSDEVNLSTAVKIRTICERMNYSGDHHKPDIETVVYDSNIRNAMGVKWLNNADEHNVKGVTNFKGQCYDIHIIGDLEHFYSVDTLVDAELEMTAKGLHCQHFDEALFWKYEYNYRSSVASALHKNLCTELGCGGPETEHKRWNAYMRAEGYVFSGSKSKASRNDLGKVHNNLVPTGELSDDDWRKDL